MQFTSTLIAYELRSHGTSVVSRPAVLRLLGRVNRAANLALTKASHRDYKSQHMPSLRKTGEEVTIEGIISIPQAKIQRDASTHTYEVCPCCGKEMKNPSYYIFSIYGGEAYPLTGPDPETINNAWVMFVGSECRKLFPKGYVGKD